MASTWPADDEAISGETSNAPPPLDNFASQSLASILNNPYESSNASSWSAWFAGPEITTSTVDLSTSTINPKKMPEVVLADFEQYLRLVRARYPRFVAAREESQRAANLRAGGKKQTRDNALQREMGEGLVLAMQQVPSKYFEEDHDLSRFETFSEDSSVDSVPSAMNMVLQEKLSHYLDVVEVHLLQEISARSDSFFEALAVLQDLSGMIHKVCDKITGLRDTVRSLEQLLLKSAMRIAKLYHRRKNLLELYKKLKIVESVSQARTDLELLVQAADFAGALDVIDDTRRVICSGELNGLHCFRHLDEQIEATAQEVDGLMTADFLRNARLDQQRGDSEDSEDHSKLEALEPLALGLLRTGRLPFVLRAYGDSLVDDIKLAVKRTISELLPQLTTCSDASEGLQAPGGDEGLAAKLRSLSSDSLLMLLEAVFTAVQAHLAKAWEVRAVVEKVVSAFGSPPSVAAVEAAAGPTGSEGSGSGVAAGDGTEVCEARRRLCKETLKANAASISAACEAAQGRWSKLLAVRASEHCELQLAEFVSIMEASIGFVERSEKMCGERSRALRHTLHTQAKAFLEAMHSRCMGSLAQLLEAEKWQVVDVKDYFQRLSDWLQQANPQQVTPLGLLGLIVAGSRCGPLPAAS
ncbi:hypothetical protein CYMTET_19293 [Cymbomonas tetramitiformis]|uniref:Vacuolar protein sorting-associated protein 54 N-terminal domain-containing protein n=1 Tax=Cymbomonas tetramitiformis TaxID=36881 RepID=A0AAE0G6D6_9CHLO|nr:hypothetical protein CYMTET_19293 [Cymbomonas tetramitiformis]